MSQTPPTSPSVKDLISPALDEATKHPSNTLDIEAETGPSLLHRSISRGSHMASRVEVDFEKGLHSLEAKIEYEFGPEHRQKLWDRFQGKGRRPIGVVESMKNVAKSSSLNLLLLFIPFAWVSHFHWKKDNATFALCFLSIIPLEKLFDYGGEQMAFYVGKQIGDLVIISLNNAVEATLAIILLVNKCELRLLQATIIGVVLLHLLLVPGTAFLTGGARIWEQNLHPHLTELNHTLLTIGVLSLLIPAAFFGALDSAATTSAESQVVSDASRHLILQMSRGIAVLLLLIYIASRIFLLNPPGGGNAFMLNSNTPAEIHDEEDRLAYDNPEVSSWFCILFLLATIVIMAVTAAMLVESIEFVREKGNITEEWFGLILLPIVSFSADGVVAIMYFIRASLSFFFLEPEPPATLAKGRAIDLGIQFTLFWMPFLILLSWWSNKPLTLLFDFYEVAVVLGACFLVNYVTADAKTNWVEGFIMVSFYLMIALCSWFYPGQESIAQMLDCTSVAHALSAAGTEGGATGSGVVEGTSEVVSRFFRY